jgi:ABC-2 type transport system permease protein
MRSVRLLAVGFGMALRRTIAFRVNLVFDVLFALVGLGTSIATILVVFTKAQTLAGWTRSDALALIGTFQIMTGLKSTFLDPNLSWFPQNGVRDGKLDAYLLQPAPGLFLASLAQSTPLALIQTLLGAGVIGVAVAAHPPGVVNVFAWLLLVAVGMAVTWTIGVLLACLAFWAPKLQLDVFYGAAWGLARYPVGIYRRPLRLILTYVFPLALIATTPASSLVHGPRPIVLVGSVLGATACVLLARLCWGAGLRRYTGATS